MFNFSANHLILLSRTEYRSCAVFALLDRDTQRVYRLFDFTKRLRLAPNRPYCVAGKVNSANTLYLVIESVKPDVQIVANILQSNAPATQAQAGPPLLAQNRP